MNKEEPTIVIFRKWNGYKQGIGDGIIALFPEMPADYLKRYCGSYERVGQHGGADYHSVIRRSKSATKKEYKDLKEELENIGYILKVRQKFIRRQKVNA